jgi:hypothetical protein
LQRYRLDDTLDEMTLGKYFSIALILFSGSIINADTINWESGNWNGGTANGYTSGSATGTTTGGAVSVQWSRFGTADGTHSGLPSAPGIQPRVLTTVGAGGVGNGVLTLGTSGDRNFATLQNYTTLAISFAGLASLANGALTIQDVDNGGSTWQDFVAVQAFNGVNSVAVNYSILPAHALTTSYGLAGVRGTTAVPNTGASQALGNVGVNFGGNVDSIVIYFFQGPGVSTGTGADHGVWLKNVEYTPLASPVPEPATVTLAGAGAVGLILLRRRKK